VSKPNQSESAFFLHEVAPDHPRALAGEPLQGRTNGPTRRRCRRAVIDRYVAEMTDLARRLVHAIAISLGLPQDGMDRRFEKPTTFLRFLHYPPQPEEAGLFGAAPHTDYGYITLLALDEVGGLEVRNKSGANGSPLRRSLTPSS
jgi:isopenicillin N synthase-like dioxygenase